jgi:hypothetical protein
LQEKVCVLPKIGRNKTVTRSIDDKNHSAAVAETTSRIKRARRQQQAEIAKAQSVSTDSAPPERQSEAVARILRAGSNCFPEYPRGATRNRGTGGKDS